MKKADKIIMLEKQLDEAYDTILDLKKQVEFLKGKVSVYEGMYYKPLIAYSDKISPDFTVTTTPAIVNGHLFNDGKSWGVSNDTSK